ncbi:uncharacterized protein LOC114184830 [Vigna unguiculata]|uniref:uncharacterized protein LOC114184830 n=1 Tax=Vigna unguiculata TaxID=3917 RepID=UPI0010166D7E|nr:uncharacterized protein LOC114184830 [Vigna unguiculata]
MPFTNDVVKHAEQRGKFFMVLALVGPPTELDYVRNQILSGTVVPSYDTVNEQLLCLSVPHMFGHSLVPPTDSSALYSQSSYWGGRSGTRGGYHGQRPHFNFCQRYGHTKEECRTKAQQQHKTANIAQIISPKPSYEVSISVDAYNEFLQYKAAMQPTQHVVAVTQSGNPLAYISQSSSLGSWILDFDDHMFGNKSFFFQLTYLDSLSSVTMANGSQMKVNGIGQTQPCSRIGVPDRQLEQDMSLEDYTICHNRLLVSPLHLKLLSINAYIILVLPKMRLMLPSFSYSSSFQCESCQLGKHTRHTYSTRVNKGVSSPFALVHSDIWRPSRVYSTLGFYYFVTFIDDFSRCTWLFLMKNCSDLFSIFQGFSTEIQNQFGTTIKILRTDNARE